jgi:hypothetical protein
VQKARMNRTMFLHYQLLDAFEQAALHQRLKIAMLHPLEQLQAALRQPAEFVKPCG